MSLKTQVAQEKLGRVSSKKFCKTQATVTARKLMIQLLARMYGAAMLVLKMHLNLLGLF